MTSTVDLKGKAPARRAELASKLLKLFANAKRVAKEVRLANKEQASVLRSHVFVSGRVVQEGAFWILCSARRRSSTCVVGPRTQRTAGWSGRRGQARGGSTSAPM